MPLLGRQYSVEELDRVEGGPLSPRRLAQIWRSLPEHERLGFLHALEERLADEVIAATAKYVDRRRTNEP